MHEATLARAAYLVRAFRSVFEETVTPKVSGATVVDGASPGTRREPPFSPRSPRGSFERRREEKWRRRRLPPSPEGPNAQQRTGLELGRPRKRGVLLCRNARCEALGGGNNGSSVGTEGRRRRGRKRRLSQLGHNFRIPRSTTCADPIKSGKVGVHQRDKDNVSECGGVPDATGPPPSLRVPGPRSRRGANRKGRRANYPGGPGR